MSPRKKREKTQTVKSRVRARMRERYEGEARPVLAKEFGYPNLLMVPRLKKVVIHTGTGRLGKEMHEPVVRSLAAITGQRPSPRKAKKSIAAFGTRIGLVIAFQCTLRGKRMYDFLDRLVHAALPRTRDFRGIAPRAFDEGGNLNIGIREHTVFPEVSPEDTRIPFGLQITVTTCARGREEGVALLRALGFPIQQPASLSRERGEPV